MLEIIFSVLSPIGDFFSLIFGVVNTFLAPYADEINGTFEMLGSLFILNHCRVLWKSKQAYGVSMLSTVFFSAWGIWNIYFYPHLDQFWSFVGGVLIVTANTIWVWMIWYLRREERNSRYVMSDTPPENPVNGQKYFDVNENTTKRWSALRKKWIRVSK